MESLTKESETFCTQKVQFGRKVKSVAFRDKGVVAFVLRTHVINTELVNSAETESVLGRFYIFSREGLNPASDTFE